MCIVTVKDHLYFPKKAGRTQSILPGNLSLRYNYPKGSRRSSIGVVFTHFCKLSRVIALPNKICV